MFAYLVYQLHQVCSVWLNCEMLLSAPMTSLYSLTLMLRDCCSSIVTGVLQFRILQLQLDRLHNYPIVPMPIVPIVRTADGE